MMKKDDVRDIDTQPTCSTASIENKYKAKRSETRPTTPTSSQPTSPLPLHNPTHLPRLVPNIPLPPPPNLPILPHTPPLHNPPQKLQSSPILPRPLRPLPRLHPPTHLHQLNLHLRRPPPNAQQILLDPRINRTSIVNAADEHCNAPVPFVVWHADHFDDAAV